MCKRETSIDCLSNIPKWGPGQNPGTCPDWESNLRPFGLCDEAQTKSPLSHMWKHHIFWTIGHIPPNLGGKQGCILQAECSVPGSLQDFCFKDVIKYFTTIFASKKNFFSYFPPLKPRCVSWSEKYGISGLDYIRFQAQTINHIWKIGEVAHNRAVKVTKFHGRQ